ncbi:MAG: hypothetical protein J5969_03695, partial [Lachnospiraceae bacterium]|nr:hypothetical protein [Lachnospiraceae bacterium]
MKRKIAAILVFATLMTGCAGQKAVPGAGSAAASPADAAAQESAVMAEGIEDTLEIIGGITVKQKGDSVSLTVPGDYIETISQQSLDTLREQEGVEEITVNEDDSATLVMTAERYEQFLGLIKQNIDAELKKIEDDDKTYPMVKGIEANETYTSFIVSTDSKEITTAERYLAMGFYMYGGMYNVYLGAPIENVHVDFVN